MATSSVTASALAQSIAGVFQGVKPAELPGSLIIAPPTPVDSPVGEFQTIGRPKRYSTLTPPVTGPNAQHQVQNLVLGKTAYVMPDPYLMPLFSITDREAMSLTSANPDLDIINAFNEALTHYLHTDHLLRTITAVNASGLNTYGTTLTVTNKATLLTDFFATLKRVVQIRRGYPPTHLLLSKPASDMLDQMNEVSNTSAIAGAETTIVTARLGNNPMGSFGRWLKANFDIELVVDETIYDADGTATWGLANNKAYLVRAAAGAAPSAFKTLFVNQNETMAAQSNTEAISGSGMFRFTVRRAPAPAQAGWNVTADSQYLTQLFDASLGEIITLAGVPTV